MAGIEVTEFRPQRSGALLGFATVEIAAIGLTVRDCPVLESGGRRWVNLPGRPVVDRDGRAKTEDGKRVYVPMGEWSSRRHADRFSDAVVTALINAGDLDPPDPHAPVDPPRQQRQQAAPPPRQQVAADLDDDLPF